MSNSERFSTENSQPAGALTLTISEILEACRRALSSIAEREGDAVRLTRDYYWSIPPEERYYVYKEPSNLTIGQLT